MQTPSQKKKKKALSTTDKTTTSKRTIRHPVSFSQLESEKIKQYAFNSKLSISEYLRRAGLRRKITTPLLKEQWQFYNQLAQLKSIANQLKQSFTVAADNNDIGNLVEQLEQLHSDMWTTTQQLLDIDRDVDDETDAL
ncbi:hypothetical protein NIES4075_70910 [Tolypothrix sp. NIES-4075]|uniref:plasmid mobilization protein n=1 Tax=Tolypothrix sp. NIES-4075 TaxID=2005459 RepID=UPI000B5CE606|nr:hypothetical protein [Tolypothrix sp. NIES-4075]GAX46070.1 hypothetical protein NIES4075_70910 [Tolypothrix sp. NIES-4075]